MTLDDQPLPMNAEAERIVLGVALTDPGVLPAIVGVLQAEDFGLEKHRRIYSVVVDLYERGDGVDRLTVANELMTRGQLESVDGVSYIVSLDEGIPQIRNADDWVQIISDKAYSRRMAIGSHKLTQVCLSPGSTRADVEHGEASLREMAISGAGKPQGAPMRLGEYLETQSSLQAFLEPHRGQPVIPVPWPELSSYLAGGLRRGNLVVLAGRTSHGKTAMGCQMAYHAAQAEYETVVFSLEQEQEETWHRLLAAVSGVSLQRFKSGLITRDERRTLQAGTTKLVDTPIWICDSSDSDTMPSLRAKIQRHKTTNPMKLVVVDQLNLMSVVGHPENRTQEISQISRGMKLLAKDLGVPIVLLVQVRRYEKEYTEAPRLSYLKESGQVEQDADVVVFVHVKEKDRADAKRSKRPCPAVFKLAKQRNGPIGTVDVLFDHELLRFEEANKTRPTVEEPGA